MNNYRRGRICVCDSVYLVAQGSKPNWRREQRNENKNKSLQGKRNAIVSGSENSNTRTSGFFTNRFREDDQHSQGSLQLVTGSQVEKASRTVANKKRCNVWSHHQAFFKASFSQLNSFDPQFNYYTGPDLFCRVGQ